jgi:hypothetical protein
VVQIWPGQTVTCLHTNRPGHIWTTLYLSSFCSFNALDSYSEGFGLESCPGQRLFWISLRFYSVFHGKRCGNLSWPKTAFSRLFSTKDSLATVLVFFFGATAQHEPGPPHFVRYLDHAQWHITVGRTPLAEGSASHRDIYLTTHNTHKRQTSLLPVGFEPLIPVSERRRPSL